MLNSNFLYHLCRTVLSAQYDNADTGYSDCLVGALFTYAGENGALGSLTTTTTHRNTAASILFLIGISFWRHNACTNHKSLLKPGKSRYPVLSAPVTKARHLEHAAACFHLQSVSTWTTRSALRQLLSSLRSSFHFARPACMWKLGSCFERLH